MRRERERQNATVGGEEGEEDKEREERTGKEVESRVGCRERRKNERER